MENRIVVDTNVLVGALLSGAQGDNREVLRRCFRDAAQPLIGTTLFYEYEELFDRPEPLANSPLSYTERQRLFSAFLSVCEWVKVYYLWRPNLPDEGDNHLVELAVAGGAEVIVTNNVRDCRRGELRFPQLRILTPSEFLETN
ncbi:MAG: PIN domain-containing protein [Planctomycetota bacterium]|nr:PIN domain-containing protein [Planctomycetota bacterium]